MASSGAHADGPHAAAPLDVQDWRCGVCLELLYKPCVAPPCGHIYCFWSVRGSLRIHTYDAHEQRFAMHATVRCMKHYAVFSSKHASQDAAACERRLLPCKKSDDVGLDPVGACTDRWIVVMYRAARCAVRNMIACRGYVPRPFGASPHAHLVANAKTSSQAASYCCIQVCTLLTSYLLRQYPAESAARAAEMKGEVGTLQ
jgi:hypothetical protein